MERTTAVGRVLVAGAVARERLKAVGRIVGAGGVATERTTAVGRVEEAGGVVKERTHHRWPCCHRQRCWYRAHESR